jgi:hypothetical protein
MLLLASPSDVNQLTLFVVLYKVNPIQINSYQVHLKVGIASTNYCFDHKMFNRKTAGFDLAL